MHIYGGLLTAVHGDMDWVLQGKTCNINSGAHMRHTLSGCNDKPKSPKDGSPSRLEDADD